MNPSFEQIIKSIEQLPATEQERIRKWLDEKGAANGESDRLQAQVNRSAQSLRWLDENREKYLGQWVALDGDRLIASGSTAKEVYGKAKDEGIEIPFVELVTDKEPVPFTGGWLS
ncbi:MAG TPA: DUF5678 domain-containing protein [Pyrinomonadaceae bacterium]|nr:DUF5678 domain-containing protein [Pyrinomonadaceae bacterium]